MIENVVDLVFLEHYFDEFCGKYSHHDDAKIVDHRLFRSEGLRIRSYGWQS